jgi:hypothetical protein
VDGAIVTPEAQFAGDAFVALRTGTLAPTRDDIIAFVTGHWRFRIWKHPAPTDWPDMSGCATADALCSRILGHLVSDYAAARGRPEARIWIDHTPEHLRRVRELSRAEVRLSGVHLIRDGRGVAASMGKVDWGPKGIATLAHWWALRIAEGCVAVQILDAEGHSIRYDDIVAAPEQALRGLCTDLGLPYSPELLTSRALDVLDYTRHQHKSVGLRPNPDRATAWQKDLSPREQEIFEAIAGNVLQLLDYPRFHPDARAESFAERVGTWLKHNPVRRRLVKRARRKRNAALVGGS